MHNKVLRTGTACFIILLLLLTSTMGLVAVKQQQIDVAQNGSVAYFSIPFDISLINPRDGSESADFLKLILKTASLVALSLPCCVFVMQNVADRYLTGQSRQPVKDKVVLLE